jgi:hypothetical protein
MQKKTSTAGYFFIDGDFSDAVQLAGRFRQSGKRRQPDRGDCVFVDHRINSWCRFFAKGGFWLTDG